jgi:MFS family permease
MQDGLRASWWIAAISFLSGIGGGVVFPILPVLGVQLGLSAAMVGLILAANRITRIACNPFTGALVDRFGARWPVSFGLFTETLAVLGFSVAVHAQSPAAWFLAGRVAWGVGSSLILVGALAAVMGVASPATRGRLTGRVRTAMTLGLPAGMLLGGVITDLASPEDAFLSAAILTFATGLFALFAMPSDAIVPGSEESQGVADPVWRSMLANPLLQLIWCSNALVFFAISGVLLATLVVLVHARGLHVLGLGSSGTAGLLMALLMVSRAVASLASGAFVDRHDGRTALLLPAALVTTLGFVGLALAMHDWSVGLALATIGLGSGALTIPMLTLLTDTTPAYARGRATGLYQVYGDIGGSLGPIVGLQLGVWMGYGTIYLGVALGMLAAAFPLYGLTRRERSGSLRSSANG